MRQILFSGVVHPERANVTISETIQELSLPDGTNLGRMRLRIGASQICALVEIALPQADLFTLRNSLLPRIESVVDNFGFTVGCGYEVELVQATEITSGEVTVFGVGLDFLQGRFSREEVIDRFKKITFLCRGIEGAYFQRVLALLRNAIRHPFETGLYCFMAVESLRSIYCIRAGLEADDKGKSWEALRADLGITKEFINDNIKAHADVVRHGGMSPFSEQDRVRVLESTWKIVELYVEKNAPTTF